MLKSTVALVGLLFATGTNSPSPVSLDYTLTVSPSDTLAISVELRIESAPASLRLAAHAHPEYDDKYWRYVSGLRLTDAKGHDTPIASHDSVTWQFRNAAGPVTVRYRVAFPAEPLPRSSWKPFLTPTGALVGGPHSFLYVVGEEQAAVSVTLDIPSTWRVGTGLGTSSTARTFRAPNVHALVEAPMLIGVLREWRFRTGNVPHRIFYWPLPNAVAFDTVAFVRGIREYAAQTFALFGSAPYEHYTFLMQDGAYSGGLEHPNSVTLGAPSSDLSKNPQSVLSEVAHEFFHTWNLMAIKPRAYREVDYRVQPPVDELWFSEGLTLFYADLLARRAGLTPSTATRLIHLENLIGRYYAMAGNSHYSAEQVSRVAYNAPEDALGNYSASSHLQGELIGAVLDLRVRDATDGAKSMDDVMRLMYRRFAKQKFVSDDVRQAVNDVCQCRVNDIFSNHVTTGSALNFRQYLSAVGLQLDTTWTVAADDSGASLKDLSVWGWLPEGESLLRLRITRPTGIWANAGLQSGDPLVSINGAPIKTWPELRQFLARFSIGDSAQITVRRVNGDVTTRVKMSGYRAPVVRITPAKDVSDRQRRLQAAWLAGRG